MSIRILIADDHEVVRRGLRRMLADTEVEVVGEAVDGHQATEMASNLDLDLVLLDVRMPEGGGLRVLGGLQENNPSLPVLMFSGYDNPNFVARSVALGARGYVLKSVSREQLLSAIRTAAAGKMLWRREELRRASGALASPRLPVDVEIPLTDRESQVLQLLAQGLTNKEIAKNLKISYETVKEHVQHILRKLGVTDRTQAAIWAVRNDVA
ncbi:MAG: response regulator transcription factor [Planctomycetota bacterium]|nr:response regulator transcription factor [Planctomycetota bacterium]